MRAWFEDSLLSCSPPCETSGVNTSPDMTESSLVALPGICLFERILYDSGLFGEGKL
jgi:hypothetical protein